LTITRQFLNRVKLINIKEDKGAMDQPSDTPPVIAIKLEKTDLSTSPAARVNVNA
jgi:hypothetical protein